jgi:acetyl-CoA synthetase
LIALKVGKSDQAQQATVSHTASLAGSDAGAAALLHRLGIGRVHDVPTFLETLKLLHCNGQLDASTLSSVSCSGGEASLAADTVHGSAMTFPPLSVDQKQALKRALGPMVALSNPLDYNTYVWRDAQAMTDAWLPMAAPHIGLTLLIVDYPHTDASDWICATEAAIAVRAKSRRPVAVVATLPELMPPDVAKVLMAAGVTPMNGLSEAIAAAEVAATLSAPFAVPPLSAGANRNAKVLTEADAKAALAAFGVSVPRNSDNVTDAGDLVPPFAIKGMGFAHKSEMNAVRLNVGFAELADAVAELPGTSVLIEEMVQGAVAEMLVGVVRDPAHGFVMTVGAGGVLTELLQDTVSMLIPASENEVKQALTKLKSYKILIGYRSKPAANIDVLVTAIMAVQAYVVAHADAISEIEINPMMCTPDAAIAADALIRICPERT